MFFLHPFQVVLVFPSDGFLWKRSSFAGPICFFFWRGGEGVTVSLTETAECICTLVWCSCWPKPLCACPQPQITIKPAKEEKPKPQKKETISEEELKEKVVSIISFPSFHPLGAHAMAVNWVEEREEKSMSETVYASVHTLNTHGHITWWVFCSSSSRKQCVYQPAGMHMCDVPGGCDTVLDRLAC